ncbi:hypothetical protein F442_23220 [Phytophthora nicotianae P10297]|uniref:SWIM-type domain-containing protein n=1 Tax=Phytophthora nicotianae P10297 TaxID=1317064 RepID=W2XYP3_PHYNI|nr:hypothetical protein F442_23220 [Phytophthora nicotianae P10297]
MELGECVETLHFLQSTAELEYASRFNVLDFRNYHGADEMLLRLAALVSPHAFELVRKEYELYKNGSLSYEGKWLQNSVVRLMSHITDCEYTVDVSTYTCSCFFMRTMLLPCHHTMFVRASMDKKKVIPVNYIHSRWLLQSEANRPEEDESDDDISCAACRLQHLHMRSVEHAVLNRSTKWKTGMDIAGGVVEAMSSQRTQTFVEMVEALREFGECVRRGCVPKIVWSENASPSTGMNNSDVNDAEDDLSDCSNCPSTRRATQTAESNADDEGAELIAETDRLLRETREQPLHTEDNEPVGSLATKAVVREKKKYNHATKAAVKPNSTSVSSSEEDGSESSSDESDKVTKQLVKESKQLGEDTNQLVNTTSQLVVRKRRATATDESDVESSGSYSHEEVTGQFVISTAVKKQGKTQIQWTLVPVKDLSLVRKTMEQNFNVADAFPVLSSITPEDSPSWKATSIVLLARKQKVHRKVRIVFPNSYVTKCIAGINTYRKSLPNEHHAGRMGVAITKLGTFAEEDLKTMHVWHESYPKWVAVNDLAEWIRVSKFTRISLPSPLNNCTTVDLKACAKRLESVSINKLIDTRFGQVQAHEVAFFRRSEWLDDSRFKLVMSHLIDQEQDEKGRSRIGGVNPLFARVHDEAMKHEVIANSPCHTTDRLILIPLYLESHWAGIVLDYENEKALLFNPMQAMTNYKEICKVLDKYFLEYVKNLDPVHQRAPRQEDTNSCGPLTLFFFECAVRGIPVPKVSRKQVEYFRFRYFFLTSKGVFCRNPDAATDDA